MLCKCCGFFCRMCVCFNSETAGDLYKNSLIRPALNSRLNHLSHSLSVITHSVCDAHYKTFAQFANFHPVYSERLIRDSRSVWTVSHGTFTAKLSIVFFASFVWLFCIFQQHRYVCRKTKSDRISFHRFIFILCYFAICSQ